VVRKETQIKAATDVKGKKIGVPGVNSVADVMFRKWLKNNGVNLNDVTFIETPFPQMNDLLRAGTVDAVLAAEPIRSRIVDAGTGGARPGRILCGSEPGLDPGVLDRHRRLGQGESRRGPQVP